MSPRLSSGKSLESEGFSMLKAFIQDESGQSTTEYVLILSAVVLIAIRFKSIIVTKIEGIVTKVGDDIQNNVSSAN